MMRCMMCGTDPSVGGAAVYRLNDKGRKGVWACEAHYADAKAQYFPDDDPEAPAAMRVDWDKDKALGPWTGGVTPVGGTA